MTSLFFATDVHGSDICWKKFINAAKFYGAEIIILGGDMTGKAIVPIIHQGGDTFKAILLEQESMLHGEDQVAEMEQSIKSRGYYPYRTTPDEIAELNADPGRVDELFGIEVLKTAERWLAYADEKLEGTGVRCYVAPGNDDMFELDDLIRTSKHVQLVEGTVIELDKHHEMLNSGWSNITPWHTYREESEDDLRKRYEPMLSQLKDPKNSVFNIHVPPYGSTLDDVPELTEDLRPKHAGRSLVPAGSHAVREIVDRYQPLLGLFGHIHEGKGAIRLGRTLCINPGSMYEQGRLLGAYVNLARNKVKNYILTTG
ncbi:MAG: metallophosphoesterase [Ardenticatenales bacterium]|nr:metallophosphoesterase [Ardenticatenales bacterium]